MTEQPQIEVGRDMLSSAGAGPSGSTGYRDRGGQYRHRASDEGSPWHHQRGLASALPMRATCSSQGHNPMIVRVSVNDMGQSWHVKAPDLCRVTVGNCSRFL